MDLSATPPCPPRQEAATGKPPADGLSRMARLASPHRFRFCRRSKRRAQKEKGPALLPGLQLELT